MAVIEKPQYHDKEAYPTDRPIFNRQTYGQQPSPPSNAPNVMESAATMFDSILGSMENLHVYQEQSARNRNTLHAKNLLVQKMKNDSELRLKVQQHLSKTPITNIDVEQIISKLKTRNRDGQTDLYLGEDLSHNISPMEIPPDTPQEVIDLIEEQWVRTDVGFAGDLMSQITQFHSTESNKIYENKRTKFQSQLLSNSLNQYKEVDELIFDDEGNLTVHGNANENLLANMNATADGMIEQGVWTIAQAEEAKDKNIQMFLESRFIADHVHDPDIALEKAKNGKYSYLNKNGDKILLNRNYWLNTFRQDKQTKLSIKEQKIKTDEKDNVYANFEKLVLPLNVDNTWDINKKYEEITNDPKWNSVSRTHVITNLISAHSKAKGFYKQKENKKIQVKIEEITLEVLEGDDNVLEKYLKNPSLTGIKNFDVSLLNFLKIERARRKKEEEKADRRLRNNTAASKIIKDKQLEIEETFTSIKGTKEFLSNFTSGSNSYLDDEKVNNNEDLNAIISALRMNQYGGQKISDAEILALKKVFIRPLILKAKNRYDALKKEEDKNNQEYTDAEVEQRMARIQSAAITNADLVMTGDPIDVKRVVDKNGKVKFVPNEFIEKTFPVGDFNKKRKTKKQDLLLTEFQSKIDSLLNIAENINTYDINQLNNYSEQLKNGLNFDSTKLDDQVKKYQLHLSKTIANKFDLRKRQLLENSVELGFTATKQDKHVRDNGVYNLEGEGGYFEWLDAYKIPRQGRIIRKEFLNSLENITKTNKEEGLVYFNGPFKQELLKYGDKYSEGGTMFRKYLWTNMGIQYKSLFKKLYNLDDELVELKPIDIAILFPAATYTGEK